MVNIQAKRQARRNFSEAAAGYGRWAGAQMEAAKILAAMMPAAKAGSALDLGSGTGFMAGQVAKKYRKARLTCLDFAPGMAEVCGRKFKNARVICADMENYRTREKYGIITSGFTFQWARNLKRAVSRWYARLETGGVFAFSMPIEGSLNEISEAFGRARAPIMEFPKEGKVMRLLPFKAGFKVKNIVNFYKDPLEALKSLKKIGASYRRKNGSLTAGEMRAGLRRYRERFCGKKRGCRLTYRVLFAVARKGK